MKIGDGPWGCIAALAFIGFIAVIALIIYAMFWIMHHVHNFKLMQGIEKKLIEGVMAAKSEVLKSVIEQIEGRPATIEDAKNVTLAPTPICGALLSEYFLYQGILVGIIETDLESASITFKTSENKNTLSNDEAKLLRKVLYPKDKSGKFSR